MRATRPAGRRGPPKSFDVDVALMAAMRVFWEKGFDGTSIADLTEAMGINRPSLYATFGNKQALFRQAIDRYGDEGRSVFAQCEGESSARRFIERLLRSQVDRYTNGGHPAGCFFIQSAIASGTPSQAARRETRRRRLMNEAAVRQQLERADFKRQLPAGFTPAELAVYLASVANGLAIRAADGADRSQLHRIVDLALVFWPETTAGAE